MRILTIRLRNLNSLSGTHTVDFTSQPLSHHQLYAITGPTGAGKTTLLDAITLALYGRTARSATDTPRADDVSDTVMSHGSGECSAELEYETATGRYFSKWYQHRARYKPRGNLQPSRREISRWNVTTEAYELLAGKLKKEVEETTEKVIGLDYARFVRSIMLAQGDFASFLQAGTADKADILEKLTGTQIYSTIGQAAYARKEAAVAALQQRTEALTYTAPLEEERRGELEARREATAATVAKLTVEIDVVTVQRRAYDKVKELLREASERTEQVATLEQAAEALRPERAQLILHERLLPISTDLNERRNARRDLGQLKADLSNLSKEAAAVGERLGAEREQLAELDGRRARFLTNLPERLAALQRADKVERQVQALRQELEQVGERKAEVDGQRDILSKTLAALKRQIADYEEQFSGIEPTQLPRLLNDTDEQLEEARASAQALTERAQARQLVDQRTLLDRELDRLEQRRAAKDRSYQSALTEEHEAQELFDYQQNTKTALEVQMSLQDHKAGLEPGTPCPLCGATDHPALEGYERPTESQLMRAVHFVNDAENALRAKENLSRQHGNELKEITDLINLSTGKRAAITEQLATTTVPVEELPESSVLRQNGDLAEQRILHLRTRKNKLQELSKTATSLAQAYARMTDKQTSANETQAKREALATAIVERQAALRTAEELLDRLTGGASVEQARTRLHTQEKQLQERVHVARASLAGHDARAQALHQQIEQYGQRLQTMEERAGALDEKVIRALRPFDLSPEAAFAALLTADRASALRKSIELSDSRLRDARALATRTQQQLAEARQSLDELAPVEQIDQLLASLKAEHSDGNRQLGSIQQQLAEDDRRRRQSEKIRGELAGLRADLHLKEQLSDLIGSATGHKFKRYAQAVTLRRLIRVSNKHLAVIDPRYRMQYAATPPGREERLEIIVVDTHQSDNKRTLSTMSGGETFLLSLALALGLSEMAGNKQLLQSLFIDEGFGTLDPGSLDRALLALERLRDQGKVIGLISHVSQLQERIGCQIQLRKAGDGTSTLQIVA